MPDLNADQILAGARRVLRAEGAAVLAAADRLSDSFVALVRTILDLPGHVVLTGVGKSGIVGMKIAATLASTGTPAFFLRPLDAVHGDLGMVSAKDLVLALSNSGETHEILNLAVAAKGIGARIAAVTSDPASSLAREADHVLLIGVEREACPLGLAPTTSTTVALAVGDALAMVLLELRGFSREDYARYHPGGSLGRRLSHRVADFMRTGERLPIVRTHDPLSHAIDIMSEKESIGVALVVGDDGCLEGILTDGDLRRIIRRERVSEGLLSRPAGDFMSAQPKTIEADELASEAVRIMEVKGITSLAVIEPTGRLIGLVHLHDILGRSKFLV